MKLDKLKKIVKEIGIIAPVIFTGYLLLIPVNPVLLDTLMILYIVVIPLLLFCFHIYSDPIIFLNTWRNFFSAKSTNNSFFLYCFRAI
jgi:hypothetical protein